MTRRKKRLLVAVAVLATFAGWRWWTAPRIDPRLVGRWSQDIPPPLIDLDLLGRDQLIELDLRRNGSAGPFRFQLGAASYRSQWAVSENLLILRSSLYRSTMSGFLWTWLKDSEFRRRMPLHIHSEVRYKIVDYTGDELTLIREPPGDWTQQFTLRRAGAGN